MQAPSRPHDQSPLAVFLIFLRLGLTSFGGPIAHLGYFREEFVHRRQWLSERGYADLVALCQFLPGPASSQVGLALGLGRAGYLGALAAWAGFTLPSALALTLFALGVAQHPELLNAGVLQGLKLAAVAVVAQAVWGMARQLCPDSTRVSIMAAAAVVLLWLPGTATQITVLALGAAAGWVFCQPHTSGGHEPLGMTVGRRAALGWLAAFMLLLVGLPWLSTHWHAQGLAMFDAFYRAGALVFGGGHVVLPLLQAAVVPEGWVASDRFLAGYGAAQAVPGPLFTFGAFLGASTSAAPNGWTGALLALTAIFLPSFLLVFAALPFWAQLRGHQGAQTALAGINAAVVGLLLSALYDPVWTAAVHGPMDFALALLAFVALLFWKWPPWLVVAACGLAGGMMGVYL